MVAVLPWVGRLTNWQLHHRQGDGSITDCLRRTRNMLSGCYLHKRTIRHIDTPIEETSAGHFPQQTNSCTYPAKALIFAATSFRDSRSYGKRVVNLVLFPAFSDLLRKTETPHGARRGLPAALPLRVKSSLHSVVDRSLVDRRCAVHVSRFPEVFLRYPKRRQ